MRVGDNKLGPSQEYPHVTLKCTRGAKQVNSRSSKNHTTSIMAQAEFLCPFGVTVRYDR